LRILVTGANGYIGQRLIRDLLQNANEVYAMVRHESRLQVEKFAKKHPKAKLHIIKADLLEPDTLKNIPSDVDVAYYLVHSMSGQTSKDFQDLEKQCAYNFVKRMNQTNLKQVIYLGGIANSDDLSQHLRSRVNVEEILQTAKFSSTILRAAIIIGSGSASFEIIRDLTEKLPIMLAPKWITTKCQPIGIKNVLEYLQGVMLKEEAYDKVFDIGGPDVLSYRAMLYGYAKARGLKRWIFSTYFLPPRFSARWVSLITTADFSLAKNLVSSLKNEVIVKKTGIEKIVPIKCYSYEESLQRSLIKISEEGVFSSWKDAFIYMDTKNFVDIEVPEHGCLFDRQEFIFDRDIEEVKDNVWSIGGKRGWYYWDWAWEIRGLLDIIFGGVGLRRGRRGGLELFQGDALDFWRVLKADRYHGHLALYAEMKLPGEAFLEFIVDKNSKGQNRLRQIATFRPAGLWGRLYWFLMMPAHVFIFKGMAKNIINYKA
jgi:uncharacterized protein YbjT (DUF2867 family)